MTRGSSDAYLPVANDPKVGRVSSLRDSRKPWAVMYFAPDGRVMNHAADYFWTRWGAERRARWMREDYDPAWTCKVVRNG